MPARLPTGPAIAFAMWMIVSFPVAALSASPEIFLEEDPEIYLIIDKLEGVGYLPELMTDDRGLEVREVAEAAKKTEPTGDAFTDGMLRYLQIGPTRKYDFRIRGGFEYSGDGRVPPNAQGLAVPENGGIRAGGYFRAAPKDWLGLQARGDVQWQFDDGTIGRLEETSIRLGWPQATLEVGKFSLWWGPGRHGALLFTTNAETILGARLRNPQPIPLGGWFRFLGLFQYDFFMARLNDDDRPVPNPLLSGLRLAVKPTSWLELGASRAMQYGGEGRSESLSTFWDVFRGKSEVPGSTPEGNSLASFDAKVRIPFRAQPVVVYAEFGGEDQSGSGFPSRWAGMGGIFLPSIGRLRRADFRIEYGDIFTDQLGVWYRHSQYPHRYKGLPLGHHMDTDAKDLFLEAHYFLLPTSFLEANADFTQRDYPGPAKEKILRVSSSIVAWLTRNVRVEGVLAFEDVRNENGVSGQGDSDFVIQTSIAYQYR